MGDPVERELGENEELPEGWEFTGTYGPETGRPIIRKIGG